MQEVGDSMLRPVKDFLGDEYSYDEIRLVRAVMRRSPLDITDRQLLCGRG